MRISFVTGNAGKFAEAEKILKPFGVNIVHKSLSVDEIRSDSIVEIAKASALAAHARLPEPLFVEDSGLFVRALNGFPGPYSAWVLGKIGNEGIVKLARGSEAEFRACIAYTEDGRKAFAFTGSVKGRISEGARGSLGFGYDPIFIPEKSPGVRHSGEKTFAEAPEMKSALSHRKRALEEFAEYLNKR